MQEKDEKLNSLFKKRKNKVADYWNKMNVNVLSIIKSIHEKKEIREY